MKSLTLKSFYISECYTYSEFDEVKKYKFCMLNTKYVLCIMKLLTVFVKTNCKTLQFL